MCGSTVFLTVQVKDPTNYHIKLITYDGETIATGGHDGDVLFKDIPVKVIKNDAIIIVIYDQNVECKVKSLFKISPTQGDCGFKTKVTLTCDWGTYDDAIKMVDYRIPGSDNVVIRDYHQSLFQWCVVIEMQINKSMFIGGQCKEYSRETKILNVDYSHDNSPGVMYIADGAMTVNNQIELPCNDRLTMLEYYYYSPLMLNFEGWYKAISVQICNLNEAIFVNGAASLDLKQFIGACENKIIITIY